MDMPGVYFHAGKRGAIVVKTEAPNSHQQYQSASQNGMQFANARMSCLNDGVLLGQSIVLVNVPIKKKIVSFNETFQ
jgi:hypothetical protein